MWLLTYGLTALSWYAGLENSSENPPPDAVYDNLLIKPVNVVCVAAVSFAMFVVPPTAVTHGQLAGNSGSNMFLWVPVGWSPWGPLSPEPRGRKSQQFFLRECLRSGRRFSTIEVYDMKHGRTRSSLTEEKRDPAGTDLHHHIAETFRVIGIHLVLGHAFGKGDNAGDRVVID
jgi:hypothetical protein